MAACPYCFAETERPWGLVGGRTALVCDLCGVIFFPRPIDTSADYQQYYPYLEGFDRARFAWELGIRRRKYRLQLRQIHRYRPEARRIVDIGAGPGYLCKVATEEGWEAIGVEASRPAIDAGRREYGVRYETLDAVGAASQDAISCHHVLEHIEEPAGFLIAVRAKLMDGGILVVHVPHQEPLTCLLRTGVERLVGRSRERHSQLYYPEHITGFTAASLTRAVGRFGFQPIQLRTVSMWSAFYDPFFAALHFQNDEGQWLRRIDAIGFVRKLANALGGNAGRLVGRGDWVIGHFRAV